jgi:hypothetical protein
VYLAHQPSHSCVIAILTRTNHASCLVYHPVVGTPEFSLPFGTYTNKYNVSITAKYAAFMCYTLTGVRPACGQNAVCASGVLIRGESGTTVGLGELVQAIGTFERCRLSVHFGIWGICFITGFVNSHTHCFHRRL